MADGAVIDSPPEADSPGPEISGELLAACVHCGFCVPVCPTWDILREENDSPRGRLYLMRAEADGRVDPQGAFAVHIGRCLGCRACESVCPAGVEYGHLLEQARARIPPRPEARRRERWLLAALTDPRPARITYAVARFIRASGLAAGLGRRLPGTVGRMLRLLAATRPTPALERPPAEPGADTTDPESGDGESYVLLEGCVMDGLFGHVHTAARRTLAMAGYREIRAPGQACCGALHAHAGLLVQARAMARANIEAFERADCDWIVTDSAGCGAGLKDYPAWLADEPEWKERAEAIASRVRDVTEILATAMKTSGDSARFPGGATTLQGRVGYDAPCHLHHGQRIQSEPLEILRSVRGLEVEELPSADRCCGGAGLYSLAHPDLAIAVRAPKLAEAQQGAYDWIATGNPGCIMYIGAGLLWSGDRTPVVHPIELVDRAWS